MKSYFYTQISINQITNIIFIPIYQIANYLEKNIHFLYWNFLKIQITAFYEVLNVNYAIAKTSLNKNASIQKLMGLDNNYYSFKPI